MPRRPSRRHRTALAILSVAAGALGMPAPDAQVSTGRVDAPRPTYHWDKSWVAQLPKGRLWGSSAGAELDGNRNIWVAERCGAGSGANACGGKDVGPLVQIDPSGKYLKSIGSGVFLQPHGLHVDPEGNVWATEYGTAPGSGKGHQVHKFSPDGKLLMSLGKAGIAGAGPDLFDSPTDVVVAPNGDIFVADGHSGKNNRIVKFTKDGKFIKEWGKQGAGPGEFSEPHCIAMDSRGRVIVGDRNNNRIQIFDQEGKFIDAWTQFGRQSGLFVGKDDTLFVIDSESRNVSGQRMYNPGVPRGIRIGSLRDGKVAEFIPDTAEPVGSTGGEGIVEIDGTLITFGSTGQCQTPEACMGVAQRRYVKK
jgi:hypothetical protein